MKKRQEQKITVHSITYVYDDHAAKEWANVFLEMIHEKMFKEYSAPHLDKHIFKNDRRDRNE